MTVPTLTNGGVKWSFAPRFEGGVGIARVPSSFDQSASDRLNGLWAGGPDATPRQDAGAPYAGLACGAFDFSFLRPNF